MRWKTIVRLASPPIFYGLANRILPWLWAASVLLLAAGLYGGLVAAPPDYQQGDGYRIIFIHVPAAWMSMFIYANMALMAAATLIWRGKIAAICTRASAPTGAIFTLLTLISGAFWGRPMWGAWWVWDARLTSELILLFLYLGYIALSSSVQGKRAAAQSGALLLLIGAANLPIIHFSVDWWNTLHQPASILKLGAPSVHPEMLRPLLLMAAAFLTFYLAAMLTVAQAILLEESADSRWAKDAAKESSHRPQ